MVYLTQKTDCKSTCFFSNYKNKFVYNCN